MATVDRVLNNRPGVKERTRDIVLETARRLGYVGEKAASVAPDSRVRLQFILPVGNNPFIRSLHANIQSLAEGRESLDVEVTSIDSISADVLARQLREVPAGVQGVGVIALDHPAVREAIRSLATRDVKVVTIASDIHHVPRVAYIGIDNRAAGRLAGYLLKRFMPPKAKGKVALFAGSLSYRGHEEREMGFRHILADESPELQIVQLREMMDDIDKAYAEAGSLLDAHPDLAAIYNVGAGNSGIARALKERNLEHKVIFLGHEATESSKELLLDGTLDALIDQNPRVEAREALNILECAVRNLPVEVHPPRLQVIFKENIPET